jgi:hypothetical protein
VIYHRQTVDRAASFFLAERRYSRTSQYSIRSDIASPLARRRFANLSRAGGRMRLRLPRSGRTPAITTWGRCSAVRACPGLPPAPTPQRYAALRPAAAIRLGEPLHARIARPRFRRATRALHWTRAASFAACQRSSKATGGWGPPSARHRRSIRSSAPSTFSSFCRSTRSNLAIFTTSTWRRWPKARVAVEALSMAPGISSEVAPENSPVGGLAISRELDRRLRSLEAVRGA